MILIGRAQHSKAALVEALYVSSTIASAACESGKLTDLYCGRSMSPYDGELLGPSSLTIRPDRVSSLPTTDPYDVFIILIGRAQ